MCAHSSDCTHLYIYKLIRLLFVTVVGSEVVDGLMQVLWGILDLEQPDTQTLNNIVISSVELIYCYAECLALHGKDTTGRSVAPAVLLFKKLLFSPNEAVRTSSRLQFLFFFAHFFIKFYSSGIQVIMCIFLFAFPALLYHQDCSRFHSQSKLC